MTPPVNAGVRSPRGRLFLVPMPLGDMSPGHCLPRATLDVIASLDRFIAENARTARRFLAQVRLSRPLQELKIDELNEHSGETDLPRLLEPLLAGQDVGLVSEAGCPVVADPGAGLVTLAHRQDVPVVALVGPSAPLLALIASGFNGQSFSFVGYLPQQAQARVDAIRRLDREVRSSGTTQILIETPYRNAAMLDALISTCEDRTLVAVTVDLTLPTELVLVKPASEWRATPRPLLDRRPAVFLLGRSPSAPSAHAQVRRRRP